MAERRYWLFKSEPSDYSFDDLMSEEDQTSEWDGVRNYTARNHLRDDVQVGDGVLFYHSSIQPPAVVGTAIVVRDSYPDDTAWAKNSPHPDPKSTPENPRWFMVDIKGEAALPQEVRLSQIKADTRLAKTSLLNRPRLSIHPVAQDEWDIIIAMGAA